MGLVNNPQRSSRIGRSQVIGHRMMIPRSTSTSTATYLQHESRIQFRTGPVDSNDIQFGYCSWFDSEAGTSGEAELTTNGNIRCALEMTTPTALAIKGKFGGVIVPLMNAGEVLLLSDFMPVTLTANTNYFAQSGYKALVIGDLIPTSQRSYNTNDRGFRSAGGSTQVGNTGSWSTPADSGSASDGWGPSLIIGVPRVPTPAVMLFGHSRISGTGDTSTGDGFGNIGYAARALGNLDASHNVIPYTYVSKSGNTLAKEDYNPSFRKRRFFEYHTHVLWDNAVNDIANGVALATLQAQALREFVEFKAAGLHVTAVCQLSKTTGAWTLADRSDQTISSGFAVGGVCDQFNAWLLSLVGGGLVDQVLDPRPLVQASDNKWLADGTVAKYTADGTHQTAFAHTLIATNQMLPWATSLTVPAGVLG